MKKLLLVILVLLLPISTKGDSIENRFYAAIDAANQRNYVRFGELLAESPDILGFAKTKNCSLYCELSQLSRIPIEGEAAPEVDQFAIDMIFKKNAPIAKSPNVIRALLVSANTFDGAIEDYPINSGKCSKRRSELFPLINQLIFAGANTGKTDGSTNSIAFFYFYQLCHVAYVCSANYEVVSPILLKRLSTDITLEEEAFLRKLGEVRTLDNECIHPLKSY